MYETGYQIKFKKGNFEFEISGDKEFVMNLFEQFKEILSNKSLLSPTDTIVESEEKRKAELSEDREDIDIPLDVYLNKYDTSGVQQKFLATALYLTEIRHQSLFRSRDINEILKENKFEPIKSISTHMKRLRGKGLISISGKEGSEANLTIYKNNIKNAKDFINKKQG